MVLQAPSGIHPQAETVLDRLMADILTKGMPLDGQEPPAAVLWPDPQSEWWSLVGVLRERLPELRVLGDYDASARSGPAIWLRAELAGALDEQGRPKGRTPILYLPRVSRQQLRAGDDCRTSWKPLVELLYRGAVWVHPNGREWTVRAFLSSRKTLALDVADDTATRTAMLQALPEVAVMPLERLRGRRLEADDFHSMLSPDPVRDVLLWMGEGAEMRARLGQERWDAFRSQCRSELGFDPQTDPDVAAGEWLGGGAGPWARVWDRFLEAPESYPRVVDVLLRSRPAGVLSFDRDRWPDLNQSDEESLRRALGGVQEMEHGAACRRLAELDGDHGARRDWVWARLGRSPMALVLEPLSRLAAVVRTTLGGGVPSEAAEAYVERGWQADAAAREALAVALPADVALVANIVRRVHLPWLEDSARAFQAAVERQALPEHGGQELVEAEDGVCLLFVDGLRYELGRSLARELDSRGLRVDLEHRWAALPTVTATGKPAVTPVAGEIVGGAPGGDLTPCFKESGRVVDAGSLRTAIERRGYQVLGAGALDVPLGSPARGFLEAGKIDALGHERDAAELARGLRDEIGGLVDRIVRLLEVGWNAVRVVTDHGWLSMPGGLPKVELPQHLTVTRGARCAALASGAQPDALIAPWHWDSGVSFAAARGVGAFRRSVEYAHGGLSVQECLIPDLTVRAATRAEVTARITTTSWRGFRCLVEAAVEGGAVIADLRLRSAPDQSVANSGKPVETDGSVSLLLADDEYEDSRLVLVLVDDEGRILARRETAVGEDS